MYDLRRNRVIDSAFIKSDWGISPEQVVDYQSLVGDSTDNVPGVSGIGPKTAAKLIEEFGSLDGIYSHAENLKGKVKENLLRDKEKAYLSRELVRLKSDIELPEDWANWRLMQPDYDELQKLFTQCGFHRFAEQLRAEEPSSAVWEHDYRLIHDPVSFESMLHEMASVTRISFDLETTSIHPTQADIVGYALSWQPGVAYYVAVRAPKGQTSLDPNEVLNKLRPFIENPAIEKIGQNLKYDMIVLRRAGVRLEGLAFDSMIASYLLEPGERNHNLDELSRRLFCHETIKIDSLIGKAGKGNRSFAWIRWMQSGSRNMRGRMPMWPCD